jgi:anti-anti-sigma factor
LCDREGHLEEDDMAGFHVQPGTDGVVYLSGELDMASADGFPETVVANDGHGELILDVGELTFIDSTGIRALLKLAEMTGPREVVLRHPPANVERVLGIVAIETFGIRVQR